MKKTALFFGIIFVFTVLQGCDMSSSDSIQREQQEKILAEGTAQVGMPAIKNFRERKILKDIMELRDQEGLVTYTYLENLSPVVIPGKTALGGKLTFFGETIGYGIPYATQFTNPEKVVYTTVTLPQADPNGLFSPGSAEGTWVLMKDPNGKDVKPVYIESRIVVSPFKLRDDS
ncbi:MAG: hypothetical protein AAB514_03070 [Patescibacteria group bacterium]